MATKRIATPTQVKRNPVTGRFEPVKESKRRKRRSMVYEIARGRAK